MTPQQGGNRGESGLRTTSRYAASLWVVRLNKSKGLERNSHESSYWYRRETLKVKGRFSARVPSVTE
jgi:hypothetical protein